MNLNREDVHVGELVTQLVDDIHYTNAELGQRLQQHDGDWPVLQTDPELLRMILENLVRNALHYTEGPVELDYRSVGKQHRIAIRDHGQGVAPELLEKLFEPFYRGDPSRTHKSGVGLGLALSQRAAAVLGGELSAFNRDEGGLEVVLLLPHY